MKRHAKSDADQTRINAQSGRRGAALIMAIVVLIMAASICLSLTVTALHRHTQLEVRFWVHQAELLADSAIDRTAFKLHQDATYRGERWEVATPTGTGTAVVQVKPVSETNSTATAANRYELTVVAHFPGEEPQRRIQRTIVTILDATALIPAANEQQSSAGFDASTNFPTTQPGVAVR